MSTIPSPFLALAPSCLCLHTPLHVHSSPFLYLPSPQLDTERSASRDLRQRLESTERAIAERTQEDGRLKAEQAKQRNHQTAKATEQVWRRRGLQSLGWEVVLPCEPKGVHTFSVHTYVRMYSCVHWLK